jgi:hypothetical protein
MVANGGSAVRVTTHLADWCRCPDDAPGRRFRGSATVARDARTEEAPTKGRWLFAMFPMGAPRAGCGGAPVPSGPRVAIAFHGCGSHASE